MNFAKIIWGLLLMLLLVHPAGQASGTQGMTTIAVQGVSQWDVLPDQAYISLAIVTSGDTVAVAQADNARLADQVHKQLGGAGIAKEYITTTQFNVMPLYKSEEGKRDGTPVIIGYQVVNGFTVTTEPARAGEIIDLALQAGANQVQNIRFGKRDETGLKAEALQLAVQDALAKAEAIAAVLGKRIVRVQTVTESGVYIQLPEAVARYNLKAADGAGTPVSPGLIHLNGNVQMVVEVK